MKSLLLGSIFVALTIPFMAQDWAPIPAETTVFYQNQVNHRIIKMRIDSQTIDSTKTQHLVYRKWLREQSGPTCDSNFLFGFYNQYDKKNELPFYHYENDSVITIRTNAFPVKELHLDISVPDNYTWPYDEHYFVRKDYHSEININGIVDSSIHFSINPYDPELQSFQVILSKHHGLVSFPYFKELGTIIAQVGFKSNVDSAGYSSIPSAMTFYQRHAGDRLLYKVHQDGGNAIPPPPGAWTCDGYKLYDVDSVLPSDSTQFFGSLYNLDTDFKVMSTPCNPVNSLDDYGIEYLRGPHVPGVTFLLNGNHVSSTFDWNGETTRMSMYWHEGDTCNKGIDAVSYSLHAAEGLGTYHSSWNGQSSRAGYSTLEAIKSVVGNYGVWPEALGITSMESGSFVLFPNPNNGHFAIQTEMEIDRIEVYGFHGEMVFQCQNPKDIDLELPSGIYFVKVRSEEEVVVQKMVVN